MRHPVLAVLTVLYFGPFVFLGPLLCTGRALGAEESAGMARIAPVDEPGEPLEVRGTVFAAAGEAPVAGIEVYVYHTDRNGYYSGQSTRPDNPRLATTLLTDAEGRYAFRTIRPGAYPGGGVAAHIHFVVRTEAGEQRRELLFEGDSLLSERTIERSKAAGRFGSVRPAERDAEGVWQVDFDLKLDG